MVLELIGEGLTNRHIGERLVVSKQTVKNYVTTMFGKLGLEQRTQATAYAARALRAVPSPDGART
jgi:DNA-binding NarL/FixJ family response regulator